MSLLLAALYSCAAFASIAPPAEKPKVIVQELKASDDMKRVLIPVKVEAKLRSIVTADVEGWVTKIQKPLGSAVKRGEVVLYLENKDPAFTFAAVPVRAPIAGVISQIEPSLMSKVSRGDRLFTVMDPASLKLSAEIPGSDLDLLQPGREGSFKASLGAAEGLGVKLLGVSPLVDPRTGTAPAELEFVGIKDKLPAIGSVGHVLFELNRGQVLLVPESAIGYADGKPLVRVIGSEGKVIRKTVELGEQKESMLVVKSGVEAGEKMVLRSSRPLKDGDEVEVETKN